MTIAAVLFPNKNIHPCISEIDADIRKHLVAIATKCK